MLYEVITMTLIPGTDTGEKINGMRLLVVAGPQELPTSWASCGDQALELQRGENVRRVGSHVLEALLLHHLVAGGDDNSAYLYV